MIDFKCCNCGEPLSSPSSMTGVAELCPKCGIRTVVPTQWEKPCSHCGFVMVQLAEETSSWWKCPQCHKLTYAPSFQWWHEPTQDDIEPAEAPRVAPSATQEERQKRKKFISVYGKRTAPGSETGRHRKQPANSPRSRPRRRREAEEPIYQETGEEATARQLSYARAVGLNLNGIQTKFEAGNLLTQWERCRHYAYGLWKEQTGRSAADSDISNDYIKIYAAALVNGDPRPARRISELVGDDGHSEEFLPADPDLHAGILKNFVENWKRYSGMDFPFK